jgi:F-type H+-transporting ATPase subunit epsilon
MVDHSHSDAASHPSGARKLQLIVVTPEATALDESVDFVALPLYDGEIGIAPGRAPLIGRLGYGELRFVAGGQTQRHYVDGGFVQVAGDVVSVLTNRAVSAASIDPAVAAEQLAEARNRKANSDELLAIRDRVEQQARAQLRVAGRAR